MAKAITTSQDASQTTEPTPESAQSESVAVSPMQEQAMGAACQQELEAYFEETAASGIHDLDRFLDITSDPSTTTHNLDKDYQQTAATGKHDLDTYLRATASDELSRPQSTTETLRQDGDKIDIDDVKVNSDAEQAVSDTLDLGHVPKGAYWQEVSSESITNTVDSNRVKGFHVEGFLEDKPQTDKTMDKAQQSNREHEKIDIGDMKVPMTTATFNEIRERAIRRHLREKPRTIKESFERAKKHGREPGNLVRPWSFSNLFGGK